MRVVSMKGLDCPYSKDKPLLCQEGYCADCEIYQVATISVSQLAKKIQVKRDLAFVDSISGSRERKVQLLERVNTYEIVLDLIDKEAKNARTNTD